MLGLPIPARRQTVAKARRELQYALLSAYFSEVKLGGAESETERAAKVFDVIQLSALETVIEAGAETVGNQIRGNFQTNLAGSRIVMSHGDARDRLLHNYSRFAAAGHRWST